MLFHGNQQQRIDPQRGERHHRPLAFDMEFQFMCFGVVVEDFDFCDGSERYGVEFQFKPFLTEYSGGGCPDFSSSRKSARRRKFARDHSSENPCFA